MEGLDERTTAFMEAPQRVELRMSGPFTKELSIDYFELSVDLNGSLRAGMRSTETSTTSTGLSGSFMPL